MMLLVVLADVDEEKGVPINVLAKLMKVDSSFITTQSKLLGKKRLLRHQAVHVVCPGSYIFPWQTTPANVS
ncbi:hypothetical protein XH97_02320 [Bradyrhizobium sp. CCBAU 53380]|nr:hypothetical protein [Bradyrhizobium sp. CCBAU 53380]